MLKKLVERAVLYKSHEVSATLVNHLAGGEGANVFVTRIAVLVASRTVDQKRHGRIILSQCSVVSVVVIVVVFKA